MAKRVLVVTSHPDDEALGCGGTISKHINAGDIVTVALLTDGEKSRIGASDVDVKRRFEQCDLAMTELCGGNRTGAKLTSVPFSDQKLDTVPFLDVVKEIERCVKKTQPEIVYTHFEGDINRDHSIAALATVTACRPLPTCSVREIYGYEVPGSTEWGKAFRPRHFVKISADDLIRKIAAFKCYKNEIRHHPHPRSEQGIHHRASLRGSECGVEYAEAFHIYRTISGKD